MNSHFAYPFRGEGFTARAYGRLDHYEPGAAGSETVLLSFELIDADWLDNKSAAGRFPATNVPPRLGKEWREWIEQELKSGINPFEQAPLFRLDVDYPLDTQVFGAAALPSLCDPLFEVTAEGLGEVWFTFQLGGAYAGMPARLYPGLFAPAMQVGANGVPASQSLQDALMVTFILNYFSDISTQKLETLLAPASTSYLAVYDVGQGNANGLLDGACRPTLYYDIGAGVYRNRHTTPSPLAFCFTNDPPVLLSHWDSDHWAGAYTTRNPADGFISNTLPALRRTWVAPNQQMGPIQLSFACDLQTLGKLFIYDPQPAVLGTAQTHQGVELRFCLGTGTGRNASGLVLAVGDGLGLGGNNWLLTGDCDYRHVQAMLTLGDLVAVVVPHHGATPHPNSNIPSPRPGRYARLVYSFGPGNLHGTVSHPTPACIAAHDAAGWTQLAAPAGAAGCNDPTGQDIRATCSHNTGTQRASILIGWDSAPTTAIAPCVSLGCNTLPTAT
jgi:hypothetical protein